MGKLVAVLGLVIVAVGVVGVLVFWPLSGGGDDDLLDVNADELKTSVVTAHLEQPLEAGKNVLWCSTFQLAWNEACDLVGEDLHVENEPSMVAVLDKRSATKADLDEPSYLAMAGWTADGIVGKIRAAIAAKFPQEAPPRLPGEVPGDARFVTYAFLTKDLRFAEPFEPIDQMDFGGAPVRAFGLTKDTGRAGRIAEQIMILDYRNETGKPDEFVVELKTQSAGDRLILAKVTPAATLGETIRDVRNRIEKGTEIQGDRHNRLKVPKLNFKVLKSYGDLLDKPLRCANEKLSGRVLAVALQSIRFRLDEHGALLRSEAMAADAAASMVGPLIFDGPFLILLQRTDATTPYFALWVDNAELLVPAE